MINYSDLFKLILKHQNMNMIALRPRPSPAPTDVAEAVGEALGGDGTRESGARGEGAAGSGGRSGGAGRRYPRIIQSHVTSPFTTESSISFLIRSISQSVVQGADIRTIQIPLSVK